MEKIRQFLEYLRVEKGYSPRTVESYNETLVHLRRLMAELDEELTWQTVDSDVVRRWMIERAEEGVKPQTVKRALSALRTFFHYLLRRGEIDRDPMALVRNPKVPKPLPHFFKESEMDRLFDTVEFPDTFFGCRDYAMLLTFYSTGVRVSELVGLRIADVDLGRGELRVTGKRNKQRVIPFGPELSAVLRDYLRVRGEHCATLAAASDYIFVRGTGCPLTPPEVRTVTRHYLSAVSTQTRLSPHVLRHTYATTLLNHGADLETVKELLGHERITTTQVYTHTSFAELRDVYAKAHPRAGAEKEE